MDEEDRKDIIKKINSAGDEDNEDNSSDNQDDSSDDSGDFGDLGDDTGGDMPDDTANDEEDLQELSVYENKLNNLFLDEPKRNNMFQPGSNDILKEGGEGEAPTRYMFFSNLEQMRRQAGLLLDLDEGKYNINPKHSDYFEESIEEAINRFGLSLTKRNCVR